MYSDIIDFGCKLLVEVVVKFDGSLYLVVWFFYLLRSYGKNLKVFRVFRMW